MVSVAILVFGGIFLLFGLAMAAFGGSGLRKWWTMRQMDPNSMVVEPGLQEFEGRAHAVDGTVTAPFTGSESLISVAHVERYSSGGEGSNWNTVTKDVETVPFEIEHSGARVAVDPENASHLLTDEFQVDTRRSDTLPPQVQAYADENLSTGSTVEIGPIELGGRRYRFTEERLDNGEEVYVLGPAEQNPASVPGGSDARLAVAPDERSWRQRLLGDPFVVSDTGEEGATKRQFRSAIVLFVFGLVFALAGIAVIVLG